MDYAADSNSIRRDSVSIRMRDTKSDAMDFSSNRAPRGLRVITGEKILISGVTGSVAMPIAKFLAQENEVWGIARFSDEPNAAAALRNTPRRLLEDAGVTTRTIHLGTGEFSDLPTDFTYVLHLAWMRAGLDQLEEAMRTNVEGPGLLLQHCRSAKAALVMSGHGHLHGKLGSLARLPRRRPHRAEAQPPMPRLAPHRSWASSRSRDSALEHSTSPLPSLDSILLWGRPAHFRRCTSMLFSMDAPCKRPATRILTLRSI